MASYQHLSKIFVWFYHSRRLKPKQCNKHLITEGQGPNRALISMWNILTFEKLMPKEHFFWGVPVCLCEQKRTLNILQLKHSICFLPVIFRYFLCSQFLCCQNCVMGGMVTRESVNHHHESEANFRIFSGSENLLLESMRKIREFVGT